MQAQEWPLDPLDGRGTAWWAVLGSAIRARTGQARVTRTGSRLLPPSMQRKDKPEVQEGVSPQGGNVVGAGVPGRLGHLSCLHSLGARHHRSPVFWARCREIRKQ